MASVLNSSSKFFVREIISTDNEILAKIIRASLLEFGAAKEGTVYFDPTTDDLFSLFQTSRSCFLVAVKDDEVVGGAGIYPTEGLPGNTCELVKFYLTPSARGKGIGKYLIEACEQKARLFDYEKIYLETMPELNIAVPLYEKTGFTYLEGPMGNSGHTGCDLWMIKIIKP